jgi:predicted NAD-dependent protein-ADP-ribosyltransferase YbiA (DUF1768 family)
MSNNHIKFYDPKDPFYEFSNFFEAPFVLDGKTWQTTEHYFQAAKFSHFPEYVDLIQACNTPGKCFVLAQQKCKGGYAAKWMINPAIGDRRLLNDIVREYKEKGVHIRPDWDDVRIEVMKKCLLAKFTQNAKLRDLLLSTGDATIIENSPRDSFWGIGKNGDGSNWLGLLLMEVRYDLQTTAP